jgi:hypothetical protein
MPRVASLSTRLDRARIQVHWEERSLAQSLEEVGRLLGVPLLLAPALQLRADEVWSLTLRETSGRSLLQILERLHEIRFLGQGEVIWATTPADAVRRTARLRIYDVRATLFAPTDFPGPRLGLGLSLGLQEVEPVREVRREPVSVDELVELIRSGTGSSTWEHEGVSISGIPGRLLVRHTPAVHRRVQRILAALGSL